MTSSSLCYFVFGEIPTLNSLPIPLLFVTRVLCCLTRSTRVLWRCWCCCVLSQDCSSRTYILISLDVALPFLIPVVQLEVLRKFLSFFYFELDGTVCDKTVYRGYISFRRKFSNISLTPRCTFLGLCYAHPTTEYTVRTPVPRCIYGPFTFRFFLLLVFFSWKNTFWFFAFVLGGPFSRRRFRPRIWRVPGVPLREIYLILFKKKW